MEVWVHFRVAHPPWETKVSPGSARPGLVQAKGTPTLGPAPGSGAQEQGERETESELGIEGDGKGYGEVHSERKPGIRKDRDPVTDGLPRPPERTGRKGVS